MSACTLLVRNVHSTAKRRQATRPAVRGSRGRSLGVSRRIRLITSRDPPANLTGDVRTRGSEPRGRAGAAGPAPRRYGFEINEGAGRGRVGRGGRVFTCGCRRRVQRAAIDAGRGARAAGAGRAPRAAPGLSPPRGRVRAVVACRLSAVRRAGVSPRPRAPGGGGEPRAARPRAHAAAARSSSAPPSPPASPAPARRRARSLAARHPPEPSAPASLPRLRPVFLWARQHDGTVQEVRCEDYDSRNRIRIARTPNGWRVIPRTEIYNSIRLPPPPPRVRKERRRRRRRSGRSRRRRERVEPEERAEPVTAWLAPDLESHIPSHTIAVPRAAQIQHESPESSPPHSELSPPHPESSPPHPQLVQPSHAHSEPTPLDNLLAVAELEFNQQRGEELELELQATAGASYAFLPDEEVARDVMSFELGEPKQDGMFFERKTHATERAPEDDTFQNDMVVHKDLFETISEAHYLPELGGPHDEELLESLVEKGCEDNQILGQALDKFAHLVHSSGDYGEEEEDILLSGAPVADIIDRLEQSLESPGQSSITAAQGLLHLHNIGDHLTAPTLHHSDEVFASQSPAECTIETLSAQSEIQHSSEANHLEYDQNAEKRLQNEVEPSRDVMYTEPVPEKPETYANNTYEEPQSHTILSNESAIMLSSVTANEGVTNEDCDKDMDKSQIDHSEDNDDNDRSSLVPTEMDYTKELEESSNSDEMVPTDLSIKHVEKTNTPLVVASIAETTHHTEDSLSDKSDDQPKDLSFHRRLPTPHASPKRIDIPRAPSRESDAMQSPQPSGIPAVPSSPEIFTMPLTKSKQALFLETLLSSPSPKMYTSEVTITKQQCEPLNLGKHRKSASPTVSSCSDEIRKMTKEYGEPQEKRIKKESAEELAKIGKVCSDDQHDIKPKKPEKICPKLADEVNPLKQLHSLKTSPDFNIPDPLLVPKDKLNLILAAPAREIPALLLQRPELRLPEAFAFPAILQDPDILVISLSQLENILENENKKEMASKAKETKSTTPKTPSTTEQSNNPQQADQTNQPKPIPSMDALAGDIDAATSAALNQMLWLPYLSQLEAMAACSQNMDFLKALNSSGYTGSNYPDLSQMFGPSAARFMGPTGFPMMSPMDYDNRLQFAMWQEAMNHANATASQRPKPSSLESQMKELASKTSDVQNPYVHSTKNSQNKNHTSAARTSPIAHNYNSNQRSMAHNPFLQGMYPGMNANMRPNMPLPGLQIPYFNPNLMGGQRSRSGQQKSPTSPYYPNNNYLQSVKQPETGHQRSNSTSSQESPRPRISVKSLQNLLEPTAAAASGVASSARRAPNPPAPSLSRRRDEPEVGSTTPLGEPPPHMPPHPHDPSSFHLWHPLFGNQKSYNSPWSWTTVTATGD